MEKGEGEKEKGEGGVREENEEGGKRKEKEGGGGERERVVVVRGRRGKGEKGGGGVKQSSSWDGTLLSMLVALLFHLLVVSGDIELNPGPGLGEYECMV